MVMRLEVIFQARDLSVVLHNEGSDTLRIWAFSNSWGWHTLSLHLNKTGSDEPYVLTQPQIMGWTINIPGYIEIPPHKKHTLSLHPGDGRWEADRDLADLKDQPLRVRAVLAIPESPEALEWSVFVGKMESEWVVSQPPHTWLFQGD